MAGKKMMKFRLMAGHHAEGQGWTEEKRNEKGEIIVRSALLPDKFYRQGDVIETHRDLAALFNSEASEKFQRVPDDTPLTQPGQAVTDRPAKESDVDSTLEAMSAAELREWAAAEELDLGKAKTKEEMIAVIRKTAMSTTV